MTALLAAVLVSVGTMGNAAPVKAAGNTSNKKFILDLQSANGSYVHTPAESKYNSTKVYVYFTDGAQSLAYIKAEGNRNTSTFYNETAGRGYALINKGVKSSITNYCFENRKSGNTSVKARIAMRSTRSSGFQASGVWSPDSTRNYTILK